MNTTPTFQMDTRESAEEVQTGMRYLAQLTERMEPIVGKMDTDSLPKPSDSSLIAIVDSFNSYEPLSHQVESLLAVAIDNVRTTLSHLKMTEELPMTALYSMIRSAIEATSYGLWILRAGTQDKKAFLSLRLSYQNNQDLQGLEKVLMTGRQEATPNARRQTIGRRLRERQRNLRSYANHDIESRPKITQIITEADKSVRHRNFVSGVQAWKVCSGIAHANMSVIRAVLERVPVGNPGSSGMSFQLTSRVTLVAALLGVAVENLETLLSDYDQACQPRPERSGR